MRGVVSLVLLVVAAWFSSSFRTAPAPVPASAPDSVFSSARAMTHLVRIASDAHPPGSPAHGRVREYLLEQLRGLGHDPTVQTTTSFAGGSFAPRAATIRNVVARIPGSDPGGRAVLVTAHYDSREIARGAGDDGSGVVTILEGLRALGERGQLGNDLIVLLTDAEEVGLLGARAFVDEHPWMEDVALVVSIEMRGGGGPSMMFETGAENGWVIEALRQADPYPSANSVGFEIYKRMPNDTDFTPFKDAGKQGLNFAGLGRAHVYHQVYDSPENFDERTLQHHGEHAVAMLQHFGNADLSVVDGPNVSYISIPFLGLVTYGALWIWVLGVATVAAWVLALLVGKRAGSRTQCIVAGFGATVVLTGAAAAAAFYLYDWRSGAHPEAGALHAGAFHSEGWYVLAIVSTAFALAAAILSLLRRWFSLAELAVGALFVPVALAAVATVMFPMAAMNFQWPALAGCIGAMAVAGLPRNGRLGLLRWLVAVVAAVPVVVVLTPLIEAVWLARGLALAPVVAVLAALVFVQLLPLLDTLREPNGWWAPLAGLAIAGLFLAVGMSTASPSADRPAPSTLVYALDRETGSAYWGTDPTRGESDPGVQWAIRGCRAVWCGGGCRWSVGRGRAGRRRVRRARVRDPRVRHLRGPRTPRRLQSPERSLCPRRRRSDRRASADRVHRGGQHRSFGPAPRDRGLRNRRGDDALPIRRRWSTTRRAERPASPGRGTPVTDRALGGGGRRRRNPRLRARGGRGRPSLHRGGAPPSPWRDCGE